MPGTGERFWVTDLDADERALIECGRGELDLNADVLVVGGGIMGVATALAFHRAGAGSVQLIEKSGLASGATGGSAGLLQPEPHQGTDAPALVELGRLSLKQWRQLEADIPGGVGLVDQNWIGLAPHADGFAGDPPPGVRWLDRYQVGELIPALAFRTTGALIERQARLNPQRAVARLGNQLPRVATDVTATSVTVAGPRITAVQTSAGTFQPGVAVFTTGTPPALPGLDLDVAYDLVKGHLFVTEPVDIDLPGHVAPVAAPIEHGRLLVGGSLDLNDETPGVRDQVIAALYGDLNAALPATSRVSISHRWCCWRPHHPDGLPVIDRLPGLDNAWFTSGHYRTGLLMGPATAELLVEWVTGGAQPALIAAFSRTRGFTGA
jgi:glycine/D-amino acid oxidase-like deaminating enzyme